MEDQIIKPFVNDDEEETETPAEETPEETGETGEMSPEE